VSIVTRIKGRNAGSEPALAPQSKGEINMRHLFKPLFLAASLVTLLSSAQPVLAQDHKYCLQGRQWGYPGNCEFSSYQQCSATASGTDSFCAINPSYAYAHQGQR
jgi:hypothetical protein